MSISANKLLYDVERKINSINSGRANSYRIVDLVSFVNDAYEIVVEHLIFEKDQNETIRNHLRPLIVSNKKLTCKNTSDKNVCKITYPSNFYELINIRVEAAKSCCPKTKTFSVVKPQGDDLDDARGNPYRRADFYFEQLVCYETNDGLNFYHEQEMEIKSVFIDYYRKITRIEAPKLVGCEENVYLDWDRKLINNNVNFEISSTYINRKITDVAAYLILSSSGDYQASNEQLKAILQQNQFHK